MYIIQMMLVFLSGCCGIATVFVAALGTATFKTVVTVTFSLITLVTAVVIVDTDGEIAVQKLIIIG